jgi:hypothetical protein
MSYWDYATLNVELLYTQSGFNPTHTDYFEFTETILKTFMERLQSEIKNDATIAAYNAGRVVIVTVLDLKRYNLNAMLSTDLFIIHSPTEHHEIGYGGTGRDDVILQADISYVVRSAKGFDATTDQEIPLVGDGTALRPSVIEGQADLAALLHNNGAMNLLESGGEPYLWDLNFGDVEIGPDDLDDDIEGEILIATRRVTGHKWLIHWS